MAFVNEETQRLCLSDWLSQTFRRRHDRRPFICSPHVQKVFFGACDELSNVTAFGTFGLLTTNITCSGITSNGDIDVNSNDIKDIAQLKFASTTVSPTGVGITSNSGWLIYNTEASSDRHWFKTDNTLAVEIKSDQVELQNGINLEFRESSSAPSGSANGAKLFAEDNGAGKTRLMVQFGSGVAQQIAIEP